MLLFLHILAHLTGNVSKQTFEGCQIIGTSYKLENERKRSPAYGQHIVLHR
jgi:hypothetical protein